MEALLNAGAAVNAGDKCGETALHRAAANGYKDTYLKLLRAGANLGAKDCDGERPKLRVRLNQ